MSVASGISLATIAEAASIASAAAGAAGAIYSATNQPGGFVAPIIKPTPINLDDLESTTNKILSGNLAKANDYQMQTTPGLVTGNQTAIDTAYKNLTGPLDPNIEGAFVNKGLAGALRSTGGGNPNAMVGGAGSATGNEVARSVANDTLANQDYNQSQFESLVASNPDPILDLTGPEAANLSAYTTQQLNNFNFAKYQQQVQKDAQGGGGF